MIKYGKLYGVIADEMSSAVKTSGQWKQAMVCIDRVPGGAEHTGKAQHAPSQSHRHVSCLALIVLLHLTYY